MQAVADLDALRELHAWMRANPEIRHARVGELELRLDPSPPPSLPMASPPADPDADERDLLATLLHSSGVDAEPFVEAMKRQRAA